ncbi:MAG: T9SS type A sorting domain-containing protein [Candidatus Glassbacteria bacterium]
MAKRFYSVWQMAPSIIIAALLLSPLTTVSQLSACEKGKRLRKGSTEAGGRLHSSPGGNSLFGPVWGLLYTVEELTDYNNQCTPTLTEDNKTIVFTYTDVNGPAQIPRGIAIATWNDTTGNWNPAVTTGLMGTRPFISPDGTKIYYQANGEICVSTWTGSEWSPGDTLPPPVNSAFDDTEPGLSLDGRRLYFSSNRPGGQGDNDIWVVRWNGSFWDSLTNLGAPLNTHYYEGWPRETADGQYLYFGSWDRDEYGWGDLWVSSWTGTAWGEPVNLGSPINTEKTACSPFVTWDMQRFYCGSEANEGGKGEEDIWYAGPGSGYTKPEPPIAEAGGWELTDDLEDAEFVYCLLETFDGTLYAGTYPNGDVFKSTDRGSNWTNTSDLDGAVRVYSLLQAMDETVYAGTYPNGDVFKTTDDGDNWIPTADLGGATSVHCMLQASDGAIYAGCAPGIEGPSGGGRIFKTTNGGNSWQPLTPIPDYGEAVLALMETGDGKLFAGGLHPQSIAYSTDMGLSWESSPIRYSGDIRSLLEDTDGVLWAAGWAHAKKGRVYVSTDDGASWDTTSVVMIGEHNASRHFAILEAQPGVIFTAFQTGPDSVVYQTTDGGNTWTSTGTLPLAREALCLLKASDGTIYAGTTPYGDVFKFSPTGIEEEKGMAPLPLATSLHQNYPNPFNPSTVIEFSLARESQVEISIYDLQGRKVKTLVTEYLSSGDHKIQWDGKNDQGNEVGSGVYFLRLRVNDTAETRKMVLLK